MTRVQPRSGEFDPDPGDPGAEITVIRTGGSQVTGQVQYPHPWAGWRWVSLWDQRAPIAVQLGRGDWTFGHEGGRP